MPSPAGFTSINAGLTTQNVYDILAGGVAFQSQAPGLNAQSINIDFANAFIGRLLGSEASAAGKAFAIGFINTRLDEGVSRGEVINAAIDALVAAASDDPDFGQATGRFHSCIDFAEHQTEILKISTRRPIFFPAPRSDRRYARQLRVLTSRAVPALSAYLPPLGRIHRPARGRNDAL